MSALTGSQAQSLARGLALLAVLALALLAGGQKAQAGALTVSSTASTGPMTLRHAIDSANTNSGHDTINFDPSVFPPGNPSTINLTVPLPEIKGSGGGVTIDGTNAGVIIDGSALDDSASGLVVTSGSTEVTNVSIKEIAVREFPGDGVEICGGVIPSCERDVGPVELHGVISTGNGQMGVSVRGDAVDDVELRNCELMGNVYGAYVKSRKDMNRVTVESCNADGNANSGVYFESLGQIVDVSIIDSSVSQNSQLGAYFDSVEETIRPLIDNVEALNNASLGVGFSSAQPLSDLLFIDSTVEGNGGPTSNGFGGEILGFQIIDATITGNSFSNNDAAFKVGGVGLEVYSQFEKPSGLTITNNIMNGNVGRGIAIITDSPGNQQVDVSTISENVVSGNTWDGIYIEDSNRVTISRNRIFANQGIGINLKGGEDEEDQTGVTPNDQSDGDTGANGLLNFPDLTGTANTATQGTACNGCKVELFIADGDPTGYGEGRMFIGEATAAGGAFSIGLCGVSQGDKVTATATDSQGNTSEFSENLPVPFSAGLCPGQILWGNSDCSLDGIRSRDAQATGKFVLQGTPLTQSEPCPDVGAQVTVNGTQRTWGNWDCSADGIRSRDAQTTGKFVLQGTPLSQTQPCPGVGSIVTVSP